MESFLNVCKLAPVSDTLYPLNYLDLVFFSCNNLTSYIFTTDSCSNTQACTHTYTEECNEL